MEDSDVLIMVQDNVSDDSYLLIRKIFQDGDLVEAGQVVAEFEGSKSVIELETHKSGFIHFTCKEGDEVGVGGIYAYISSSKERSPENQASVSPSGGEAEVNISAKARQLMKENNLTHDDFPGKRIIRTDDILRLLAGRENGIAESELDDRIHARSLIVYGIGSHADVVQDVVISSGDYELCGFVDYKASTRTKGSIPVLSHNEFLSVIQKHEVNVYVCLPTKQLEEEICAEIKSTRAKLVSIISQSACVAESSAIDENVFVGPNCTIGPRATLGQGVRVLNNASIAHHAVIQPYCWVSDGARIGGAAVLGEGCKIGLNSSVNKKVKLGAGSIVNSNVAVTTDQGERSFVR